MDHFPFISLHLVKYLPAFVQFCPPDPFLHLFSLFPALVHDTRLGMVVVTVVVTLFLGVSVTVFLTDFFGAAAAFFAFERV